MRGAVSELFSVSVVVKYAPGLAVDGECRGVPAETVTIVTAIRIPNVNTALFKGVLNGKGIGFVPPGYGFNNCKIE